MSAANAPSRDEINRIILRTPKDGVVRGALLSVSLTPHPASMALHLVRTNVTNHLLRDIITGLFLSLDEADQLDEMDELIAMRHTALPAWSSRMIADKLRAEPKEGGNSHA